MLRVWAPRRYLQVRLDAACSEEWILMTAFYGSMLCCKGLKRVFCEKDMRNHLGCRRGVGFATQMHVASCFGLKK